ncbi:MAG: metallophosphoesterase [Ruminococcus sp.]
MMIFAFLLLCFFALLVIISSIERHIIVTRRDDIALEKLPENFDGLKILQISDLHHRSFGRDQCRIVRRAKALKPDIIVITGDLISRDMRDFSSAAKFCSSLCETATVLFSMGNHELDLPEKVKDTYLSAMKNAGVHLLLNTSFQLSRGSQLLDFTGLSLESSVYHGENFSYKFLDPYSLQKIESSIGVRKRCTVLLAHNPLIFDAYAAWSADLILSGHVHGGVIRLPLIGGILSPERRFFPSYTRGLYSKNASKLYVSAGLGKFRLFNPPEINLITLRCAD